MDWFMCISKLFMFGGIIIVHIYRCKTLHKSLHSIYWLPENGGLAPLHADLQPSVHILDCNYINTKKIIHIIRMLHLAIQFVWWLGNELIPYLGNENYFLRVVAIKIDWFYLNICHYISRNTKSSDTWLEKIHVL